MNVAPRLFVTLVSGLPRSGTSMMMQMLEAGGIPAITDNLRQADDDNPKGYYECEAVKRTKQDAGWLKDSQGKVVKVIYMLLQDLPDSCDYRVVFMNRELDEVLASQQKMLDRRGEPGANVAPDQMKRIFEGQLEKTQAWLSLKSNYSVLNVNYQDVVANPQEQSNRINDFLGGGLDTSKMAAAVTKQLYRQRSAAE